MPQRSLIVYLVVFVITSTARLILEDNTTKFQPAQMNSCPALEDEPVGEVMERICDLCHELNSHSRPNTRIECRANCFSTDAFRDCLKLFTPRRHTRHIRTKY